MSSTGQSAAKLYDVLAKFAGFSLMHCSLTISDKAIQGMLIPIISVCTHDGRGLMALACLPFK